MGLLANARASIAQAICTRRGHNWVLSAIWDQMTCKRCGEMHPLPTLASWRELSPQVRGGWGRGERGSAWGTTLTWMRPEMVRGPKQDSLEGGQD